MPESIKEKMKVIKRNIVLEAAEKLFYDKGYDNSSADDIAKEAGISKSTLYTYFNSKEEILVRVFIKAAIESSEAYEKAVETGKTGYEKMKAYSKAVFNCYLKKPEYLDLYDLTIRLLQKGIVLNKETRITLRTYSEKNSKLIVGVMRKGIEDGSLRHDLNVKVSYSYFMNTIQHIAKFFILSPNFNDEEYNTALEYFLEGFKAK